MPDPRIHSIRYKRHKGIISNQPQPALLAVCKESRYTALNIYTLRLHTDNKLGRDWINPVQDTIYIELWQAKDLYILTYNTCHLSAQSREAIQNLAVDFDMIDVRQNFDPDTLLQFSGLKNFICIMHEYDATCHCDSYTDGGRRPCLPEPNFDFVDAKTDWELDMIHEFMEDLNEDPSDYSVPQFHVKYRSRCRGEEDCWMKNWNKANPRGGYDSDDDYGSGADNSNYNPDGSDSDDENSDVGFFKGLLINGLVDGEDEDYVDGTSDSGSDSGSDSDSGSGSGSETGEDDPKMELMQELVDLEVEEEENDSQARYLTYFEDDRV